MKLVIGVLWVIILMAFTFNSSELKTLAIGDNAPRQELMMEGVDGEEHSLKTDVGENGLLVIFSCNTCPFVVGGMGGAEGWEGRYNEVYNSAKKNGVEMLLVNSNEAKRSKGDSMKDMKERANKVGLLADYVIDNNHVLADAFGAKTTPHVFLFDKSLKLVYTGAIDDNVNSASEVKQAWLKDAMMKLASGKKIDPASTRNTGCSIKRK